MKEKFSDRKSPEVFTYLKRLCFIEDDVDFSSSAHEMRGRLRWD